MSGRLLGIGRESHWWRDQPTTQLQLSTMSNINPTGLNLKVDSNNEPTSS